MKRTHKHFYIAVAIASSSFMPLAHADEAMAKSKGCMACHRVDAKLVGPSYKEVAAKYKADAGAAEYLAKKIKDGGSGVWGKVPMAPNKVSDEEASVLAKWVLSL